MKKEKPPLHSEEELRVMQSSREEYMSLFSGRKVSRNKILQGGPMLEHTIHQLSSTGALIGQEVFDFNPEGGVIFDTELWLPKYTNGLDRSDQKD